MSTLAILPTSSKPAKQIPNLLPARIQHNGPVDNVQQYWKPETGDGKLTATLRGRSLHGTTLSLPANYTGAILRITDTPLPDSQARRRDAQDADGDDDMAEEEEEQPDVKIAEQIGTFDEFVVWGHGGKVDEEGDAYCRAIREWVGFAGGMHSENEEEEDEKGEEGQKEGRRGDDGAGRVE